jgi:hypothetical protein
MRAAKCVMGRLLTEIWAHTSPTFNSAYVIPVRYGLNLAFIL